MEKDERAKWYLIGFISGILIVFSIIGIYGGVLG